MVNRFLVSALALLVAVASLSTGTMAWFYDAAMTGQSSFTAGTLDLQIADNGLNDPDPWGDSVDLTWVMGDMIPGESSATNTIALRNVGTVRGDHIEIRFTHTIDEATNPVESDTNPASSWRDFARWIEITDLIYDGVALKFACTSAVGWDVNGNGWLDLEDVASDPIAREGGPLDNLPPPEAAGGVAPLAMSLRFRPEATNDIQGDILNTTLTVTLNQDSSQ